MQFALPSEPPLLHGSDSVPNATKELVVESSHGSIVEMLIRNVAREAHPFHMHGHKFALLEQGQVDLDACKIDYCVKDLPGNHDRDARFDTNLHTAVFKDTVVIPGGGWVRIRWVANNPGCVRADAPMFSLSLSLSLSLTRALPTLPVMTSRC